MKKLVLYYLYLFLVLDTLMGVLLVTMGLEDTLVINPGQFVRTTLLVFLFVVLIKDALKRFTSINSRILLAIIYFGVFVAVIFLKDSLWTAELYNVAKLIFIMLLIYYINKHKHYFLAHFDSIMLVNFIVLSLNLWFAFITGWGINTYGESLDATNGFIYAGNAVSVICLVFFSYYFFKIQTNPTAKYLSIIAVINIYIVGTKAIYLVPIVILIYLATKVNWTWIKILVSASILVPLIIAISIAITPLITEIYQNRYLDKLQETGLIGNAEDGSSNFDEALMAYRRVAFAIEQVDYQFSDIDGLIFGYGEAGQKKFWTEKGHRFTYAAMDFIDFLFEYGLVGCLLFYSIIFYSFYGVIRRWEFNSLTISFIFIFLYSFFGGYVIYNSTAATMFALLIALNLPKQRTSSTRTVSMKNASAVSV